MVSSESFIRENSKSETRNKSQSKKEKNARAGFQISIFVSDFEFRISSFANAALLPAGSPARARLRPDPGRHAREKTSAPARRRCQGAGREDRTDGNDPRPSRRRAFRLR